MFTMFTIKNNQIDIKYELVGGAANVAAAAGPVGDASVLTSSREC